MKAETAAQASLDLPGLGNGLTARKAELEGLISGLEGRLKALGADTIAPHVDGSMLEQLKPKADEAKAAVESVGAVTARPTIDISGITAAESAVDRLLGKLAQVGSASAAAGSINVGAIKARSRSSFSDGVTPGAGAE